MLNSHINNGSIYGQTDTSSIRIWRSDANVADDKTRNRGIFGMLPPTLQRSGKNVFQQGRNGMES